MMDAAHRFGFTDEELDGIAVEIWEAFASNIPRYKALAATGLRHTVIKDSRAVLDVYLTTFSTRTLPSPATCLEMTSQEWHRMSLGFEPDELQRAAIFQSEIIWNHLSVKAPAADLPALASLTLRLVDVLAGSRSRAVQQVNLTRSASVRSYVSQLLINELETGTTGVAIAVEAGKSLGYDLSLPSNGVVIATHPPRTQKLNTPEVQSFHRAVDRLPTDGKLIGAAVGGCYHLIAMGVSRAQLESAIDHVIAHTVGLDEDTARVGVGASLPGASGIQQSILQADRARTLGGILEPDQRYAYYEDLRPLDVLTENETAITAFTRAVLQPLVEYDDASGAKLLETLQVMFDAGWSRKLAASTLRLHPNTIDYRVRQAEKLLGIRFDQGRASFKVLLALQLASVAR